MTVGLRTPHRASMASHLTNGSLLLFMTRLKLVRDGGDPCGACTLADSVDGCCLCGACLCALYVRVCGCEGVENVRVCIV